MTDEQIDAVWSDTFRKLFQDVSTATTADFRQAHRDFARAIIEAAAPEIRRVERERCAVVCENAKPRGGRMWTDEQAACFDCLTHVAAAIRSLPDVQG